MRLAEHKRGHLSSSLFLHGGDDVGVGIERDGDRGVPGCYSSHFPVTTAASELDV